MEFKFYLCQWPLVPVSCLTSPADHHLLSLPGRPHTPKALTAARSSAAFSFSFSHPVNRDQIFLFRQTLQMCPVSLRSLSISILMYAVGPRTHAFPGVVLRVRQHPSCLAWHSGQNNGGYCPPLAAQSSFPALQSPLFPLPTFATS